jgi:hypothetical protein
MLRIRFCPTVLFAVCALALGMLALAATARAADYKMVLCAAGNGAGSFATATNTASPQHPGGIISFGNHCGGSSSDPAGGGAYLRIEENQPSGHAGNTAYGSISWTVPPWIEIRGAGGYTRQPHSFNAGWRGRFWAEGWDGSTNNILMQGSGVANGSLGGVGWARTSTFASHLWPFGGYGNYRRFVFELTCMRPAGRDRGGTNAVDANSLVLVLADVFPSGVAFTNTGSPFLAGKWVRGDQAVTYSWTERGSGIRFERVRIDGSERHRIDHASQCSVGFSGSNGEFARSFHACREGAGVQRSHGLDTGSLPDGAHAVQVCIQDFAQHQGMNGTGGESCAQRTVRTDNTAPGKPAGLEVTSSDPERYLSRFAAKWSLPPDPGSPIEKVHYEVIDSTGQVVTPKRTVAATDPTEIAGIEGPEEPGAYRLRVWLEDEVGFVGPAAVAKVPRDDKPPAAPQRLSAASPDTPRSRQGFDARWGNVADDGSPIVAAHYQVRDGSGRVVVPTETEHGNDIRSIERIRTPRQNGRFSLRLWLSDAEGNTGAPARVPLTYECVRSPVEGGRGLTAALDGAPAKVVPQGQGATLRGRLRGSGGGLAGAPLCVFSQVEGDRHREFLGVAITGTGGTYRFIAGPGPSRG